MAFLLQKCGSQAQFEALFCYFNSKIGEIINHILFMKTLKTLSLSLSLSLCVCVCVCVDCSCLSGVKAVKPLTKCV